MSVSPVILAGGEGRRLYPLSTPACPKPFLRLPSGLSMLQETALRLMNTGRHTVICQHEHAGIVAADYRHAKLAPPRMILEPARRNTGPAVAAAAFRMKPEALMLVLPCDHWIGDCEAFRQTLADAASAARTGLIVLLGITPDGTPETRYGYIRPGEALESGGYGVSAFIEKPGITEAVRFVNEGCYWNSGIFIAKAGTVQNALLRHAPEISVNVRKALLDGRETERGNTIALETSAFSRAPAVPFDIAVLEKADGLSVLPFTGGWQDIGTLDSFRASPGQ